MTMKIKIKRIIPKFCYEFIINNYRLIRYMIMHIIPIEWYIRIIFKAKVGYSLDLANPKTFNEKLQWLKINDHNKIYTTMVDKYEAKEYIARIIGEEYIIPTIGVWDNFDDIDFDLLPNQFVLKCTHDSGSVVICKEKRTFNRKMAKKILDEGLKYNYYYSGFEWPYKNVKARIIAEKYMDNNTDKQLTDYKLMCFHGKVKYTFTCTDRNSNTGLRVTFFDNKWKKMPFYRHYPSAEYPIKCPDNFQKMKELAEKISVGLKFARIDFYEISGKVYFGEVTFFPGCGYEEFHPVLWDRKIGDYIKL